MVAIRLRKSAFLRSVICGLVVVFATLTITTNEADARRYKQGKSAQARGKVVHNQRNKGVRARAAAKSYSPPYAAIVVDANSGAVLHENAADAQRHPASLTKIMTLYLLFERLEVGKIKLSSEMDVSARAASQSPSKLGLKAGSTLRVEDAIKALVTKSANDAAVVVAETLGGDEDAFARQMTRKARALGMSRTLYRNASGLPNSEQITTARDQAVLGRAIQDRFPTYYRYFSTHSFTYRGHAMRNHNRLLGSVQGVDGIKTGYVAASGFNLVTSVRRGNRYIVAVVMGGRSAGLRDARMRELIDEHVVTASTRRTVAPIVEVADNAPAAAPVRARPEPIPAQDFASSMSEAGATAAVASPATTRADPAPTAAIPGNAEPTDDLKPIPVRTVRVKASTLQTAAIGSVPPVAPPAPPLPPAPTPVVSAPPIQPAPPPVQIASVSAPSLPLPASEPAARPSPARVAAVDPIPAPAPIIATEPPAPLRQQVSSAPPVRTSPPRSAHSGWLIQVGALESVEAANDRITEARNKAANVLRRADAYTEPVTKGDKTLHRARFVGFDKDHAEAACKALKRADIVCMAIKN